MQVKFGNLSVTQFEEKTGTTLLPEDREWLNSRRIDTASFKEDNKFHIFDLPFCIIAGHDIGEELVRRLQGYNFQKHFYVETKEPSD